MVLRKKILSTSQFADAPEITRVLPGYSLVSMTLFTGDIQHLFTHAPMEEGMRGTPSALVIERPLHMWAHRRAWGPKYGLSKLPVEAKKDVHELLFGGWRFGLSGADRACDARDPLSARHRAAPPHVSPSAGLGAEIRPVKVASWSKKRRARAPLRGLAVRPVGRR